MDTTRLRALGRWASRRAWSRAGAMADAVGRRPVGRALGVGGRAAMLVAGSVIIAAGVAVMLWNDLGPGPLDVFIGALRATTGLPLMFAVWLTLAGLAAFAWLLGRPPKLGTLVGPLITGPAMQAALTALDRHRAPDWLPLQVVVHIVAIALVGVGAGLVITAGLGAGTGELLAAAASDRSGRPEPRVRMAFELTWLVFGVALGGPIGPGTVLVALMIGPAVEAGRRLVDTTLATGRRRLAAARVAVAA